MTKTELKTFARVHYNLCAKNILNQQSQSDIIRMYPIEVQRNEQNRIITHRLKWDKGARNAGV